MFAGDQWNLKTILQQSFDPYHEHGGHAPNTMLDKKQGVSLSTSFLEEQSPASVLAEQPPAPAGAVGGKRAAPSASPKSGAPAGKPVGKTDASSSAEAAVDLIAFENNAQWQLCKFVQAHDQDARGMKKVFVLHEHDRQHSPVYRDRLTNCKQLSAQSHDPRTLLSQEDRILPPSSPQIILIEATSIS